jgi:hypothetical protein
MHLLYLYTFLAANRHLLNKVLLSNRNIPFCSVFGFNNKEVLGTELTYIHTFAAMHTFTIY